MNWMFHMPTMVAVLNAAPPEAALMVAARVASAALCIKACGPTPAWAKTNGAWSALTSPHPACTAGASAVARASAGNTLATNRNVLIIDIPLSFAGDPLGLPHAHLPRRIWGAKTGIAPRKLFGQRIVYCKEPLWQIRLSPKQRNCFAPGRKATNGRWRL